MRVGIKYCGGCNPLYRREMVEEVLREAFPEFYFHLSSSNPEGLENADLVVCISGCERGCAVESVEAASQNIRKTVKILSIDDKREREEIIAEFNGYLKDKARDKGLQD